MVKVHKVTVMVIDHDGIGAGNVKIVLENARYPNRCISPDVMSIKTDVEWSDDHPLNNRKTQEKAYWDLFPQD